MSRAIATTKLDIVTPQQAMDYLKCLHAAGLLYHLDDDPRDCLGHHGLTVQQLDNIEHNVNQILELEWIQSGYDCPFDFIIRELI